MPLKRKPLAGKYHRKASLMKAVSLLLFLIGCATPFPIEKLDSPFGAVLASDTLSAFVAGRPVAVDPFVRLMVRGGPDPWSLDAPVIDTLQVQHLARLSKGGAVLVPHSFSWRTVDSDTILIRISRYDLDPQSQGGAFTVMVFELIRGAGSAHRFLVAHTENGWQVTFVDFMMI